MHINTTCVKNDYTSSSTWLVICTGEAYKWMSICLLTLRFSKSMNYLWMTRDQIMLKLLYFFMSVTQIFAMESTRRRKITDIFSLILFLISNIFTPQNIADPLQRWHKHDTNLSYNPTLEWKLFFNDRWLFYG